VPSTHEIHPFSSARHRIPAPLCRAHSTGRSESSGRRLVKAGRLAPQAKILRSTVDCSCQNPHLSLLQHTLAALPSAAAPSRPRLLLIRSAPAHTDLYIYILTCACELTRRWTQRTAHAGQHGAARGSTGQHTARHAQPVKKKTREPHRMCSLEAGCMMQSAGRSPAGSVVGTRRFAACSGIIAASPQASSSALSEHLQHANTQTTCLGTDIPCLLPLSPPSPFSFPLPLPSPPP